MPTLCEATRVNRWGKWLVEDHHSICLEEDDLYNVCDMLCDVVKRASTYNKGSGKTVYRTLF